MSIRFCCSVICRFRDLRFFFFRILDCLNFGFFSGEGEGVGEFKGYMNSDCDSDSVGMITRLLKVVLLALSFVGFVLLILFVLVLTSCKTTGVKTPFL